MILNSLSTVGIATQVWNQATRSLTALGAVAIFNSSFAASISASTSYDARPAAGKYRDFTAVVTAAAAGALGVNAYNGTTQSNGTQVAAAGTSTITMTGTNNIAGIALKNNDGVNPATYTVMGADYQP